MEKVIYLVWRAESADTGGFSGRLRGELAEGLLALGAHGVQVNVMDADVAPAAGLRQANMNPQPEAFLSLWVDSASDRFRRPFDAAVSAIVPRMAAYLVSESVPIPNTLHPAMPGQRTSGWSQIALLGRPPRLAHEAWRDIWLNHHTQVAIDTQSSFLYVQNLVTRVLTYGAPAIDAIVEEGFPLDAMASPSVFFAAAGDEEKFKRNLAAMMESCARFIDFDRIDVLPTSQYVIKRLAT